MSDNRIIVLAGPKSEEEAKRWAKTGEWMDRIVMNLPKGSVPVMVWYDKQNKEICFSANGQTVRRPHVETKSVQIDVHSWRK